MCVKWSNGCAQIVTNMQQLIHSCIRDEDSRVGVVTPQPLGHNPGGHIMGPYPKNHNKTGECQKNKRKPGFRATPRGNRTRLHHYSIFRPDLRWR